MDGEASEMSELSSCGVLLLEKKAKSESAMAGPKLLLDIWA